MTDTSDEKFRTPCCGLTSESPTYEVCPGCGTENVTAEPVETSEPEQDKS